MCSWYPVTSEKAKSRRKGRQRRYDYLWDLDDGRPGFVRQTKRDRLRIFVDSDSDGLFTESDELVGRARIKKAYRGIARGNIIEDGSFGSVTAFNALEPSSAGAHADLSGEAGLVFGHPDGGVAAVFARVVLPDGYL